MAVITYADVATAIGRPISDSNEQGQVTQWIADVELILTARLGDLSTYDQDVLAYVVREAVISRMRHRAESHEDKQPGSEDNFFIRVLEPWWYLLDPGESGSAAFSVRPSFDADEVAWPSTIGESAYAPGSSDWRTW